MSYFPYGEQNGSLSVQDKFDPCKNSDDNLIANEKKSKLLQHLLSL